MVFNLCEEYDTSPMVKPQGNVVPIDFMNKFVL